MRVTSLFPGSLPLPNPRTTLHRGRWRLDGLLATESNQTGMNENWQPVETTTHQDHVIAHVLGATVPGYFRLPETLHLLLDIGFVWTIFLDGQMGLLPHPVAVNELEISAALRSEIKNDIEILLSDNRDSRSREGLGHLIAAPIGCQITEVTFFEQDDRRCLIIAGEEASLAIETSLTTGEIDVYEL